MDPWCDHTAIYRAQAMSRASYHLYHRTTSHTTIGGIDSGDSFILVTLVEIADIPHPYFFSFLSDMDNLLSNFLHIGPS